MFLSADKIICQTSSWLFDVIFDQPNNFLLSDKIETVQYIAILAITPYFYELIPPLKKSYGYPGWF